MCNKSKKKSKWGCEFLVNFRVPPKTLNSSNYYNMMSVSIHAVIQENTASVFVGSEKESCAQDTWDACPRLRRRGQHSRDHALAAASALSWTSGKVGSNTRVVPPCFRKWLAGMSSDGKALKLMSGSSSYRTALLWEVWGKIASVFSLTVGYAEGVVNLISIGTSGSIQDDKKVTKMVLPQRNPDKRRGRQNNLYLLQRHILHWREA